MATKIGFKAKPLIDSGGVDWLSVTKDVVKTLTEQMSGLLMVLIL